MKTILFGNCGWLGSAIVNELQDHCQLCSFDRANDGRAAASFRGDVRRPEDVAEFFTAVGDCGDAILIHTASVIHPRLWVKELYQVNVSALQALLHAFVKHGGSRVIYISSNSPFGAFKYKTVLDESSPYRPYLNYGRSKQLAEQHVLQAPVKSVIFRVPWFYGDQMPARQKDFYEMIRKGKFPIFGTGQNIRSVVNVQDVARAVRTVMDRCAWSRNEQYWLATASYSMMEMVARIRALMLAEDIPVQGSNGYVRVPGVVSDIFRLLDRGLQAIGVYHTKVHVVGELNLNIECSSTQFAKDYDFSFSDFDQTTRDILKKYFK
jgi:nucleoside-diphosphate-sugar epimerase